MPAAYNQGDIYFCDPDPQLKDTVGSEQKGDHVWVIVSVPACHRGNCVVAVPLSKHLEKAGGHLTQLPTFLFKYLPKEPDISRVALVDQIRVLDKTRLRRKVGTLSQQGMSAVFQGIDGLFGRRVVTRPVAVAPQSELVTKTNTKQAQLASPAPAPAPSAKPPAHIPGTPTGTA